MSLRANIVIYMYLWQRAHFLLIYKLIMFQQTPKDIISFSGIGLHTGCHDNVRILPAKEDTGIVFKRTDIQDSPKIKASGSNVVATAYATTLGVRGVSVSTVEHLLAAFYGLGIDNAIIELDGPEVPILDGSAAEFIGMLQAAGIRTLPKKRKYLVVKRPIKVYEEDKYVLLLPSGDTGLTIDYSIDFSHRELGKQTFSGLFSKEVFRDEVGSARTFGFLGDVEMLRRNGFAKGGSLKNVVVIGDDKKILNEEGLRYPDEFVRHKVLDMMGDISLVGAPVIGRLIAHRSGHSLNFRLVQQILARPHRWQFTENPAKESTVEDIGWSYAGGAIALQA